MSIINLKKTFENGQFVYCNIDNKIIECICLSELSKYSIKYCDNEYLKIFICNKVKVITIYDIYKNIFSEPIRTDLFKDSIKIGTILENFKKDIYFFKTFMEAFIQDNKLNGIQCYPEYRGTIYKILYNNIELRVTNSIKFFSIYNNKGKCINEFKYEKKYIIYYKNYNDDIIYVIRDDNCIEIKKGDYPYYQTIYCHTKNLKVFKIEKCYRNIKIYEERNDNNEIISLKKYDKIKLQENFICNDMNCPFSKSLSNDCIELIDYYKENINNYIELIESCLKKEKEVSNILLLNNNLEMINSK